MHCLPIIGSTNSQVSTTYSVSKGAQGASTPSISSLAGHDTGRTGHQAGQLHRQGISHSHALTHGLSHQHSLRDHPSTMTGSDRKYGTLAQQPRKTPPTCH